MDTSGQFQERMNIVMFRHQRDSRHAVSNSTCDFKALNVFQNSTVMFDVGIRSMISSTEIAFGFLRTLQYVTMK